MLFAACFRLLAAAQASTRQVPPGALLAAGCLLAQALGGVYVTAVLAGSSPNLRRHCRRGRSALLAAVASELILIAAEFNVVLARRIWTRSLTGELLEADKQALPGPCADRATRPRARSAPVFLPARCASNVGRVDNHVDASGAGLSSGSGDGAGCDAGTFGDAGAHGARSQTDSGS
jgi:hypothetical protein